MSGLKPSTEAEGEVFTTAKAFLDSLPASRAKALALTKLEECAMWAAFAQDGLSGPFEIK